MRINAGQVGSSGALPATARGNCAQWRGASLAFFLKPNRFGRGEKFFTPECLSEEFLNHVNHL
jgi:hypothetical protein